jgi:hypothetical protein
LEELLQIISRPTQSSRGLSKDGVGTSCATRRQHFSLSDNQRGSADSAAGVELLGLPASGLPRYREEQTHITQSQDCIEVYPSCSCHWGCCLSFRFACGYSSSPQCRASTLYALVATAKDENLNCIGADYALDHSLPSKEAHQFHPDGSEDSELLFVD